MWNDIRVGDNVSREVQIYNREWNWTRSKYQPMQPVEIFMPIVS